MVNAFQSEGMSIDPQQRAGAVKGWGEEKVRASSSSSVGVGEGGGLEGDGGVHRKLISCSIS